MDWRQSITKYDWILRGAAAYYRICFMRARASRLGADHITHKEDVMFYRFAVTMYITRLVAVGVMGLGAVAMVTIALSKI